MEKLFDQFDGVNKDEWIQKIEKDLKGKPLDVLTSHPERDIEIVAYHHKDDKVNYQPIAKSVAGWIIRKEVHQQTNQAILNDLNEGVTGLGLTYSSEFNQQTKGVLFEHIWSDIRFNQLSDTINAVVPEGSRLNCDIFARAIQNGEWPNQKGDFSSFVANFPEHKTICINGNIYGEAGATSIEELACVIAQVNEYIELLKGAHSLSSIQQKLVIYLSVTDNYFVNIAKFNVVRNLIAAVFQAHEGNHQQEPIELVAVTSQRYLSKNDANTNLLRQTTQAMSAVLGGCDVLSINGFEDDLSQRMAKNISLILQEESYLDKVVNPTEGTYYLNTLSAQILEKAWIWFKEIENAGGFCAAIEQNLIQNRIDASKEDLIQAINEGKKTFLGVNKFQSTLEEWTSVSPSKKPFEKTFKALVPLNLEQYFTNTVNA